ncbi:hypothetical protein EDC36_12016 [Tepidimonas ignava]|uniref:Uncharacterized protein n=1 Tax=Tepidimonas ignava TaxID=114249 RepID=A0A4R3L7B3_9BURK|nr:hypothetical protein [Tepidimonas ignava]TCS94094.1 hypothetical protein EDC36_12016 [Tepidimonas ignava]TSE18920.1 hypothetical protein Tigna_02367 [Tepidimonas ignava]
MSEAIADIIDRAQPAARQQAEPASISPVIKQLFQLLHGAYGGAFIAKFATGEKDAAGKDRGIRSAMIVWQSALAKYPAEVIEAAAQRATEQHPDFPPHLPQFEALCKAAAPRKTYAEQHGLPPSKALPKPAEAALRNPAGFEPKNDGRDWARRILARKAAGETINGCALRMAREAMEAAHR